MGFHVAVPGVHGKHSPAVGDRGLGQVGQGPMDLLLDQRGPLVTGCRRFLTDLAKPRDALRLHSDCVSSLSVIGLSRTFILWRRKGSGNSVSTLRSHQLGPLSPSISPARKTSLFLILGNFESYTTTGRSQAKTAYEWGSKIQIEGGRGAGNEPVHLRCRGSANSHPRFTAESAREAQRGLSSIPAGTLQYPRESHMELEVSPAWGCGCPVCPGLRKPGLRVI